MKKLAVLSIALLVLTTLAFAEVKVEPVVAFSGSGTLTWGIDLDTTANTGFKNENTANLTVTLVSKTSETKGMMAEGDMVYGYIALKDMSLVFNTDNNFEVGDDDDATYTGIQLIDSDTGLPAVDDDGEPVLTYFVTYPNKDDKVKVMSDVIVAPSIEAYVVLGPAKWFIYGSPDVAISFAGELENDNDDNKYWAEGDDSNAIKTDGTTDFNGGGTGIEVALGPATVSALIMSAQPWDKAAADPNYAMGLKAGVTAGPATIKAGFSMPLGAAQTIGFGGSAAVTAGPASINAAADFASTGGTLAYEIAGGATVTLPDLVTIGANAAFGDVWDLDIEASVELKAVPDLTFKTIFGLWNATEALAWGLNVNGAYKVAMGETNYVKPGVDFYVSDENPGDMRIVLVGSVEAVLIPNTTFTLKYTDKNLTDAAYGSGSGLDRALTFATKVAY